MFYSLQTAHCHNARKKVAVYLQQNMCPHVKSYYRLHFAKRFWEINISRYILQLESLWQTNCANSFQNSKNFFLILLRKINNTKIIISQCIFILKWPTREFFKKLWWLLVYPNIFEILFVTTRIHSSGHLCFKRRLS